MKFKTQEALAIMADAAKISPTVARAVYNALLAKGFIVENICKK